MNSLKSKLFKVCQKPFRLKVLRFAILRCRMI